MAEEKKLNVAEVRKTMATSLAAAFGLIIALMWNNVVISGLSRAGVPLQATGGDWTGWLSFLGVAIMTTTVLVVLVVLVSRWGTKA